MTNTIKELTNLSIALIPIIFVSLAWVISDPQESELRNTFCEYKGFEKSTDMSISRDYMHIECDKNHRFKVQMVLTCWKQNKWGECVNRETALEIDKGTYDGSVCIYKDYVKTNTWCKRA
jgi:hypothetical protein